MPQRSESFQTVIDFCLEHAFEAPVHRRVKLYRGLADFSITQALRRPDPRYRSMRPRSNRLRDIFGHAKSIDCLRTTDRRTWQQREADQFGSWYPFVCAARAEEQHARRVSKAQATLRHFRS